MKQLVFSCYVLCSCLAFGQDVKEPVPRFEKITVTGTTHGLYLPKETTPEFELSYSPDSSRVYTGEVTFGNFNFAAIVVDFNGSSFETEAEKEELITSYMEFLQTNFGVTGAAGLGFGHTLPSEPTAIGAIDYWEDEDGNQYAVKAWMNANTLAVLLLYGKTEYPYFNAQDMFLNGFRF